MIALWWYPSACVKAQERKNVLTNVLENCKTQIPFYIVKLWKFEDLKSETGYNTNSRINLAPYVLEADKRFLMKIGNA